MKVENANKALNEHRGKLGQAEQHLASAQHNKHVGENERHRHKEALTQAHVDNRPTPSHEVVGGTATTQPIASSNAYQAPAVGAH